MPSPSLLSELKNPSPESIIPFHPAHPKRHARRERMRAKKEACTNTKGVLHVYIMRWKENKEVE